MTKQENSGITFGEHEKIIRIEQGSTVWFKKGVTIHYKGKQLFEFLEDVTIETPKEATTPPSVYTTTPTGDPALHEQPSSGAHSV